MNYTFMPGLELNRGFYHDLVKPILNKHFPGLSYAAALIGYGSDVFGFDNATSMDHNWGPRMILFFEESQGSVNHDEVRKILSHELPLVYEGFPTNYSDPMTDGTITMKAIDSGPVNHLVETTTVSRFLQDTTGVIGPDMSHNVWLSLSDQALFEMVSGEVFYDGPGLLTGLREKLSWFPRDVYLLRLASLWRFIEDEEPFIGRCNEIDDPVGLKIISARLVNTLMKICFYLERHYTLYGKWLGTAFKRLACYDKMQPLFMKILRENDPERIEDGLCDAYEAIVAMHNKREDLPRLSNKPQYFFNRPYRVIFAETIVETLINSVQDEELKETDLSKVCIG